MINKIVFDDKIILYWEKDKFFRTGRRYCLYCGGKPYYTEKTHFEVSVPKGKKSVEVGVELVDEDGGVLKAYEREKIYIPEKKKIIDVTMAPYFAVGDGRTLNTACLQRALNACGEGETLYFPKGVFLTGALDVFSDTEIYLEEGAVLQGSSDPEDYLPKIKSRFEGIERMCYRSLLNLGTLDRNGGYFCKNVVLRGGNGAILGGGAELMKNIIDRESASGSASADDGDARAAERTRGRLINVSNAQNVIIYGLELGMSPSWNVHMTYSDNVVTANCYIHSEGISNGDGWDPDSSTNCTIFNCDFSTRDDMIAIKSGNTSQYWEMKICKARKKYDILRSQPKLNAMFNIIRKTEVREMRTSIIQRRSRNAGRDGMSEMRQVYIGRH